MWKSQDLERNILITLIFIVFQIDWQNFHAAGKFTKNWNRADLFPFSVFNILQMQTNNKSNCITSNQRKKKEKKKINKKITLYIHRQSCAHNPWIWVAVGLRSEYDMLLLLFEHVNVYWLPFCWACKFLENNLRSNQIEIIAQE